MPRINAVSSNAELSAGNIRVEDLMREANFENVSPVIQRNRTAKSVENIGATNYATENGKHF